MRICDGCGQPIESVMVEVDGGFICEDCYDLDYQPVTLPADPTEAHRFPPIVRRADDSQMASTDPRP